MTMVVTRLSVHGSSVVYGPRVYTNGESATVTTCIHMRKCVLDAPSHEWAV